MANTVVTTQSVQWTPPAAAANSGQSSFTGQASYNAQNVGEADVPSGTAPATIIPIPFGQVSKARVLIVKSLMTSDVDIRLNGSTDPVFTLPPNGKFTYECPADPTTGTHPLVSATAAILVSPTNVEKIQYFIFGD